MFQKIFTTSSTTFFIASCCSGGGRRLVLDGLSSDGFGHKKHMNDHGSNGSSGVLHDSLVLMQQGTANEAV